MKGWFCLFFCCLIHMVFAEINEETSIGLPAELTDETFDSVISEGLTFVEFYSPYCSHCKELAPIWKETYQDFNEELKHLKIDMRQVNCVESGDLCSKEEIFFYPNLRLYAPDKDGKSGKHVDSFPRIPRSTENFKKYLKNSVADYDSGNIDLDSSSQLLSNSDFLKIIAGESEEPTFVSLWPATNLQYKSTDEKKSNHFTKCPDCFDLKRTWDKLSNQILANVRTGHFNCRTNKKICEILGFKDLTQSNRMGSDPAFVMFLPKEAGIIRFDYRGNFEINSMKEFALRMAENYRYELITGQSIEDVMDFPKELKHSDAPKNYTLNKNQISFVYYFDKKATTPEDKDILPYILETITESPFNVHIFTASDSKFEQVIENQEKKLLEYIHYNESEPLREFDYEMYLTTRITSKPTLFCFKDGSLISSTYQNFAPDEIRNSHMVNKWIRKNSFPLIGELSPDISRVYFDKNDKSNDKVLITFIDSKNTEQSNEIVHNLTLAAHEFSHMKKEYYYKEVITKRQGKDNNVKKLKAADADSIKIVNEMRKEVPHQFHEHDVLFTYLDLSKYSAMVSENGWGLSSSYKPGDSILVDRNIRYFIGDDQAGFHLKSKPMSLRQVLLYSLSPTLVNLKLRSRLVNSPYGDQLRILDNIHQYGFMGYLLFFGFIYLTYYGLNRFRLSRRRRTHRQETGLGILGINIPKSD